MSTDQPENKIPQSIAFKWLVILIVVFLVAISAGVYFAKPIHSAIDSLTPVSNNTEQDHDHASTQYYTCGMHPWIILPKPGECPICFMKLTPLDPAKFTGEIAIDPIVVQNMGVRTAPVTTGPLVQTINTVGTVDYNETLVRDINIKIAGWIEKLHVDYMGAKVSQGDPLFELYAPELYAAQEEYLIAYRSIAQSNNTLLESARTRLRYFDITDAQIAQLQKDEKPSKTLTISSPYTGVVIAKKANEGMKVDPGMQVYRIADLSKIWVLVTLYEYQLPYIQMGNKAIMSLPYIPGHTFEGTVVYIYPYLDKKTREVQVRLEFDNPNGLLKPGMFANVKLENQLAKDRVLAPREAIIDTGTRKVAFVALGNGRFEPHDIMTGIQTENDRVEILQGLEPGQQVVTSGQFLLDSESKIRAALARMISVDKTPENKGEMTGKATAMANMSPGFASALNNVINMYLATGDHLASDKMSEAIENAPQLATAINTLILQNLPGNEHFWHKHAQAQDAMHAANQLAGSVNIDDARQQYATISINLLQLLKETGVPATIDKQLMSMHCPMFGESQGGSHWIQAGSDVRNPFFGSTMLRCSDKQDALPVTPVSMEPMANPTTQPAPDKQDLPNDPAVLLDQLTDTYLQIQHQLTLDKMDQIPALLKNLKISASLLSKNVPENTGKLAKNVVKAADISTQDAKAFRQGFAPLSDAMTSLLKEASDQLKPRRDIYQAYCPMVKKFWLQTEKEVRNPYAPYMLDCGSIKEQITKAPAESVNGKDKP